MSERKPDNAKILEKPYDIPYEIQHRRQTMANIDPLLSGIEDILPQVAKRHSPHSDSSQPAGAQKDKRIVKRPKLEKPLVIRPKRALQPAPPRPPPYYTYPGAKTCFYDLPAELRVEVYKLVFQKVVIHVLPPQAQRDQRSIGMVAPQDQKRYTLFGGDKSVA